MCEVGCRQRPKKVQTNSIRVGSVTLPFDHELLWVSGLAVETEKAAVAASFAFASLAVELAKPEAGSGIPFPAEDAFVPATSSAVPLPASWEQVFDVR